MSLLAFISMVTLFALTNVAVAESPARPFATQPVEKDGLQVTLIGDKAVFAKNEPVNFTVRFKNVSTKPLSLLGADEFENWVIRFEHTTSRMPWRLQSRATEEPRPGHLRKELRPGESLEISTKWGTNRFPFQYESELVLNLPIPPVENLTPGRYQFWLGITLKKGPEATATHLAFRGDINVDPVEIEISDRDDPTCPQASEPAKENSAEFQTVTRTPWVAPAANEKSEVLLGLRVTNRTGTWMQVNAFDSVQVVLKNSHGDELRCVRVRDATKIPEPLLLMSRETRTLYRNATLEWSDDRTSLRLIGSDGAGGTWEFADLKPGKYTAHFIYECDDDSLKPVLARPGKHIIDSKEALFWTGKATTKDLAVELVPTSQAAIRSDADAFTIACPGVPRPGGKCPARPRVWSGSRRDILCVMHSAFVPRDLWAINDRA